MDSDFETLLEFLALPAGEVQGRAVSAPEEQAAAQIERFARGECTIEERSDVCLLLRQNPAWLRWLAERVKQARPRTGAARL